MKITSFPGTKPADKKFNFCSLLFTILPLIVLFSQTAFASDFKILLVEDAQVEVSQKITLNLARILSDASVDFEIIDQKAMAGLKNSDFEDYRAICLLSENASLYAFPDDILGYISNGGILCVGIHSWNNEWFPRLGIELQAPDKVEYADCSGLVTHKPIFKDARPSCGKDGFSSSAIKLNFSPDWETLMSFKEPDLPLFTRRKQGKGQVLFFNSSALSLKLFRGVFLYHLFKCFELGAYSVLNANLLHLDDSPPPAYGIKEGPVYRDLGMTDRQFHMRVWVKEVFSLLEEFAMPVTHFLCMTYNDEVEPPFASEVDREPFFSKFLALAMEKDHEIAFHGYNHQSPTLGKSPSTPWPDPENIEKAYAVAYDLWQQYKLPPTLVFVPPNNVIDEAGKRSLIKGFPTIRVNCRLYQDSGIYNSIPADGYSLGKVKDLEKMKKIRQVFSMYAARSMEPGKVAPGLFYGDEFGVDPDVPELLNLPRISSGYHIDGDERLLILSEIMGHGAAIHFIHPDDVYDPARRKNSWEQTLMALRRVFIFFKKYASHLFKRKTGDYVVEFKKYVFSETRIASLDDNSIVIEPDGRKYYYLFSSSPQEDLKLENSEIIAEIEPGVYLLKADKKAKISVR